MLLTIVGFDPHHGYAMRILYSGSKSYATVLSTVKDNKQKTKQKKTNIQTYKQTKEVISILETILKHSPHQCFR